MNKNLFNHLCQIFPLLILVVISAGCSEDQKIGSVTGTVQLDGVPIDLALVTFYPEFGRASVGRTDEQGNYTLNYISGQKGALVGQHKVTISTKYVAETNYTADTYNEDGIIKRSRREMRRSGGRKEMLRKIFYDRKETVLTAVVRPGKNEIDFNLDPEKR